MKVLGIILATIIAIIFSAIMALGYAIELGFLPSPDTLPGDKIRKQYLQTLKESKIINEDEVVHFFYSDGLWSVLEDGNLFTDKRVISYETIDDKLNVYEATYDEITAIEFNRSNEAWSVSEIEVTTTNGGWLILWVDNGDDMDKAFLEKLTQIWKSEMTQHETDKVDAKKEELVFES